MELTAQSQHSSLNDNQKRRLQASCHYIDKLLSDIEGILNSSSSGSPFLKYRNDLTLAQRQVAQDYIARIRAQLVRVLEAQHAAPPNLRIGARHAVRNALQFVDIAIEELKPEYIARLW